MKLISCHIENFGRLSDLSLDFSDGLTAVCRENGWGKSTLAVFLKVMFYGFDGENKKALTENERKHYAPWQKGIYGGQLILEKDGRRLCLSRIFGSREKEDEAGVTDALTGAPVTDIPVGPGEPGLTLFGIDGASFAGTIYIAQNESAAGRATDGVHARITGLTDSLNDLGRFESADQLLKKWLDTNTGTRKTGNLRKLGEQVTAAEVKVRNGQSCPGLLERCSLATAEREKALAEVEARERELGREERAAAAEESLQAERRHYRELLGRTARKKEERETQRKQFPGSVPSGAAIQEALLFYQRAEEQKARIPDHQLTKEEKRQLSQDRVLFGGGIPAEAVWQKQRETVLALEAVRLEKKETEPAPEESAELEELERLFKDRKTPSQIADLWESCGKATEERRNREKAAEDTAEAAAAAEKRRKKGRILRLCLTAVCVLFLLAGGLFWLLRQKGRPLPLCDGACLIAAAVSGLVLLFLMKNRNKEKQAAVSARKAAEEARERLETVTAAENAYFTEVTAYLNATGCDPEQTVTGALMELSTRYQRKTELTQKKDSYQEADPDARIALLEAQLSAFLRPFGLRVRAGEEAETLNALKRRGETYYRLNEKDGLRRTAAERAAEAEEALTAFYLKYRLEREKPENTQLTNLNVAVSLLADTEKELAAAEKDCLDFEREHRPEALQPPVPEERMPSSALCAQKRAEQQQRIEALRKEVTEFKRQQETLEEQYDAWTDAQAELARLKEEQKKLSERYRLTDTAKKLLTQAKEKLTERYAAPMRDSFRRYFTAVTGENADRFFADADGTIRVEEAGMTRDTELFSAGYRDLIGICVRLSLADAMYRQEKPLLIMDDPFVNLDDGKASAAAALLKEAARNYQVLYLSCSRSRMPAEEI